MLNVGSEPLSMNEYLANMGGPMSRTRREHLSATVLGRDDGGINCPRVRRVGLNFGDQDPLVAVSKLLAEAGIRNPEKLRGYVDIPAGPLICRPDPEPRPVSIDRPRWQRGILRHVLILGLSTSYLFDPARPVLLTRASLTRCLEIFDAEGYYA
jgi:hypothetical protein